MKRSPLGATVVITALTVAVGATIMPPPRVSVYPVKGDVTIAETAEGMKDHAFTHEEMRVFFTHHRSQPNGHPELMKALRDGKKPHVFLSGGPEGTTLCYTIDSLFEYKMKLVQPPSTDVNWRQNDCVVLKV